MTDIGHIGTSTTSHGISSFAASGRVDASGPERTASQTTSRDVHAGDRVEISEHAQHLSRIKALPEVRQDLISAARAAIEDGTLDTPRNLEIAVGLLLDEQEQL
jgi:anti-sigma28 factor (negative regulator of flagellin synthesis)